MNWTKNRNSLSFILNFRLLLTSSIAGYSLFKIFIGKEYKEPEKFFGEEYLIYKNRTPEFSTSFEKTTLIITINGWNESLEN
jgi:hypothetical protein